MITLSDHAQPSYVPLQHPDLDQGESSHHKDLQQRVHDDPLLKIFQVVLAQLFLDFVDLMQTNLLRIYLFESL
jgi:hypothetical protein